MEVEWKKVFLYAIVPAVIAGVFSIGPKLYDIAVEPKTELNYSVISGPEIEVSEGFQQIISIHVKNSGKSLLNNVQANLIADNGIVVSKTIRNPLGNKPMLYVDAKSIDVTFSKLHAGETLSISALVQNKMAGLKPTISLRSDETLGQLSTEQNQSANISNSLLPTALSTIVSVLAMGLFFLTRISKGKLSLGDLRPDIIFYIAITAGLNDIANFIKSEKDITYLKMADLLLLGGLTGSDEDKSKHITALKLMLLVSRIADTSKMVIIHNIKTLEGTELSPVELVQFEQSAAKSKSFIELRQSIDEHLLAEKLHVLSNKKSFLKMNG